MGLSAARATVCPLPTEPGSCPVPHDVTAWQEGTEVTEEALLCNPLKTPYRGVIIESQKHQGWKRPLISSRPTVNPSPPCLLNHVLKCHIYMVFEHPQGW